MGYLGPPAPIAPWPLYDPVEAAVVRIGSARLRSDHGRNHPMPTAMTPDDVRAAIDGDDAALVIDVLPHECYAAGHIPGSISAPLEDADFLDLVSAQSHDKEQRTSSMAAMRSARPPTRPQPVSRRLAIPRSRSSRAGPSTARSARPTTTERTMASYAQGARHG